MALREVRIGGIAGSPQPCANSGAAVASAPDPLRKADLMDIVFLVVIMVLYGVTHWLAAAISRLGGIE